MNNQAGIAPFLFFEGWCFRLERTKGSYLIAREALSGRHTPVLVDDARAEHSA